MAKQMNHRLWEDYVEMSPMSLPSCKPIKTTWGSGKRREELYKERIVQLFSSIFVHRFFSNSFESGMGFQLKYESSDMAPQVIYRIGELGECGGTFTFPVGTFTSPSYPDSYPNNADCIYTISQPTGHVILLNFLSMNLYYHECSDYLEIRDGPSGDSPLLDKLCESEIPAPIQTTQNQLWMKCEWNFWESHLIKNYNIL